MVLILADWCTGGLDCSKCAITPTPRPYNSGVGTPEPVTFWWGSVARGETIPPTLAPTPTPTAAEPPVIGQPIRYPAVELFLPFVGKEGSTMKGGSGINPVR